MESLLETMSGVGILFAVGYLILTIFIIVYFFRIANDVRELKETLNIIKKHLVKSDFNNSVNEKHEVTDTLSNESIIVDITDDNLKKLEELLRNRKGGHYNSINKNDHLNLLKSMINSKETAQMVIDRYSQLFNKDIITELKKLTTSYDGIKNNLSSFIEYKVVASEYPHDFIK